MLSKKAQTAIEFIILVGLVIFFFAVFFLTIQESTQDKLKEKQNSMITSTAYAIQDEINLAFKASDGYSRSFEVPEKIGSQDYNVTIADSTIYLKDSKNAVSLPIPSITGNLVKGINIIRKENGSVIIN